jgi:hypothetical protein
MYILSQTITDIDIKEMDYYEGNRIGITIKHLKRNAFVSH